MKGMIVVAAGTLALMSGVASAGDGGCAYGKHLASLQDQTPVIASAEEIEAKRLEELEKQASLDTLIEVPPTFN